MSERKLFNSLYNLCVKQCESTSEVFAVNSKTFGKKSRFFHHSSLEVHKVDKISTMNIVPMTCPLRQQALLQYCLIYMPLVYPNK
jgi:hypothetical protein